MLGGMKSNRGKFQGVLWSFVLPGALPTEQSSKETFVPLGCKLLPQPPRLLAGFFSLLCDPVGDPLRF